MTSRNDPDTQAVAPMSRRDLFLGAGLTAGTLAALGAVGGVAYAPATQAAVSKSRKFFATNVLLELDGQSAGRLIAAEGGEPVIVPAAGAVGGQKVQTQTTLRYEPLSLILGDMSAAMYDWIGKATIGAATPHQVQVITSNLDGKEIYRLAMQNVRLTEIRLDDFDVSAGNDTVRFHVRMAPGQSAHQFGGKGIVNSPIVQKRSRLTRANFRLYIQGLEAATIRATSIDSIRLQARDDGTLGPSPLKFAVPFNDAGPLFTWMQDTLTGKASARPGELQILTPDLKNVASSVSFSQLSILRISSAAAAAFRRPAVMPRPRAIRLASPRRSSGNPCAGSSRCTRVLRRYRRVAGAGLRRPGTPNSG